MIEDNQGDIRLMKEAVAESFTDIVVDFIDDGEKAMTFFAGLSGESDANHPHLIFMDLNLPKISGLEILKFIKGREETKHLPVIVFSSSESATDIVKSYKNLANCYVAKPKDYDSYLNVIKMIKSFWFDCVSLPKTND